MILATASFSSIVSRSIYPVPLYPVSLRDVGNTLWGPHPTDYSERKSRTQLGFQRLRTRREAYHRAVETNFNTVRGNWVGRRLHVQEGFVIAMEDHWVATSKKLKVMYSPLNYTDMLFVSS